MAFDSEKSGLNLPDDHFANLIRYLSHMHPVYSCADEIRKRLVIGYYPAKTVILRPGQVANNFFFVETGCLAASETRDGKDIYKWVLIGPTFAQSARSFFTRTVSTEKIECLESSVVMSISYDDLYYLVENYHDFSVCMFKLMAHVTVMREMKFAMVSIPNSEMRVRRMAMLDPELFKRVPLNILATFLSMTPETLSRITHKKDFLPLLPDKKNKSATGDF